MCHRKGLIVYKKIFNLGPIFCKKNPFQKSVPCMRVFRKCLDFQEICWKIPCTKVQENPYYLSLSSLLLLVLVLMPAGLCHKKLGKNPKAVESSIQIFINQKTQVAKKCEKSTKLGCFYGRKICKYRQGFQTSCCTP